MSNIDQKFLRGTSSQTTPIVCDICQEEFRPDVSRRIFINHVRKKHSDLVKPKGSEADQDRYAHSVWEASRIRSANERIADKVANEDAPPMAASLPDVGPSSSMATASQTPQLSPDHLRSPASSLKREGGKTPPPVKRSKAQPAEDSSGFDPRPKQKGKLWTPDGGGESFRPARADKRLSPIHQRSSPRFSALSNRSPATGRPGQPLFGNPSPRPQPALEEPPPEMLRQPETRPISQEQLVAEVKGIYAGLVMVENKCIEVNNNQSGQTDTKLSSEQWQALIALHRTLLHEHHDFFLASQHPSASVALRRLAPKYAMPARMWRHGIHSFLELLRHRLPASQEHMLTFIHIAYSMMALLYETVSAFEDTWIECLGDLGRYRMAIEEDVHDREVWTQVSRRWYSKASDKSPATGRLYHHLAILARPNALQQLFYYNKALCVAIPFESARDSIMTLLDPVMTLSQTQLTRRSQLARLSPNELAFVRCHGILFSNKNREEFDVSVNDFIETLGPHIARLTILFAPLGYYMGISICCSLVGYGNEKNPVFAALKSHLQSGELSGDQAMEDSSTTGQDAEQQRELLSDELKLANRMNDVILRRFGDPHILPYLHVILVFMSALMPHTEARLIAPSFPWKLLSLVLNALLDGFESFPAEIEKEPFPAPESKFARPLPEDYAMRGLLWADQYFPSGWFDSEEADDGERFFETTSMADERKKRVLYLGCRIAAQDSTYLVYDSVSHRFSITPTFDVKLPGIPEPSGTGELDTVTPDKEMVDADLG